MVGYIRHFIWLLKEKLPSIMCNQPGKLWRCTVDIIAGPTLSSNLPSHASKQTALGTSRLPYYARLTLSS
jgi:hypothetical protein